MKPIRKLVFLIGLFMSSAIYTGKAFSEDIHLLCVINFTLNGKFSDALTYHLKLIIDQSSNEGRCEVLSLMPNDRWIIDGSGYALRKDDQYVCESIMANPVIEGTHPVSLFIVNRFTGAAEVQATKSKSYFGSCKKLLAM